MGRRQDSAGDSEHQSHCHSVTPTPDLHLLRDEPDNRILECAMAAQAEWIVSGDRHLLAIKRHASSAIMSLADFLAETQR
ncbi:MAG: putative toxin-antitoxin system toxin component, PIN family [Nitrospiraceae bacterium]